MTVISTTKKGSIYKESAHSAQIVREYYRIGDKPIADIFSLLEQNGFLILSFHCEATKFSGFYTKRGNKRCIYVNSHHSLGKQNYSLAHELYHAFFEPDKTAVCFENDISTVENEYFAECFASHFLMPESEVLSVIKTIGISLQNFKIVDAIRLQHYFKVSLTAIIIKLSKMKLITYDYGKRLQENCSIENAQALQRLTRELGYDVNLILPTQIRLPDGFRKDLEKNFKDGKIDEEKYAEVLSIVDILGSIWQKE